MGLIIGEAIDWITTFIFNEVARRAGLWVATAFLVGLLVGPLALIVALVWLFLR